MVRLSGTQKRAQTLAKVHQAAIAEIAANGIPGLSIDRLTEAAGFSRGVFYGNYRSKEEMLLELMRESAEQQLANWKRFIDEFTDLDSFLTSIGNQFDDYTRSQSTGLFWVELSLHARRSAKFAVQYEHYIAGITAKLEEMLRLVFDKLGLEPSADPALMAHFIRNLVHGTVLDSGNFKASDYLKVAFRNFVAVSDMKQAR